tara:strand:+ start:777 stop:968 length:192 start_codon:yes stop_codon:yes gene_type:complete
MGEVFEEKETRNRRFMILMILLIIIAIIITVIKYRKTDLASMTYNSILKKLRLRNISKNILKK